MTWMQLTQISATQTIRIMSAPIQKKKAHLSSHNCQLPSHQHLDGALAQTRASGIIHAQAVTGSPTSSTSSTPSTVKMGPRQTKPEPPAEPKSSVNAKEIIVHEERNNYPSLVNIDARNDHFGGPGSPFQLHWWSIVGIIAAILFLFYVVWRIRRCCDKCKKKKVEKEAQREAAEQARDSRLEAIAMSPIIMSSEDLTEKFRWNSDRFEELNEKIDKMKTIVETEPAATEKFIMSPQANLTQAMAQLPPVTLPYGNSTTNFPAITFLDNGRPPRRNRGRRH